MWQPKNGQMCKIFQIWYHSIFQKRPKYNLKRKWETKIQIIKWTTIQLGGCGVLNGEIYKGPNLRIGDTPVFYTQRTNKAWYTVHKRLETIHKRRCTIQYTKYEIHNTQFAPTASQLNLKKHYAAEKKIVLHPTHEQGRVHSTQKTEHNAHPNLTWKSSRRRKNP